MKFKVYFINPFQHYTTCFQSEHHMLVEVYKDIETSILRGYMVVQLSLMIRGLRETGNTHTDFPQYLIMFIDVEKSIFNL